MQLSQPHAHLALPRQLPRGPRVPLRSKFGGSVRYPNQRNHGRTIIRQVAELRAIHAKRVPVLGVSPELVVVLHVNAPLEQSIINAAKLHVLELFEDRVVVAAPDDAELTAFLTRVEAYATGPRAATTAKEPTAPYQSFLDRIDAVRPYAAADVPSQALLDAIATLGPDDPVKIDVHCWCPEVAGEARERHESVRRAVLAGDGRVLDATLRHAAGLSLLRADVPVSLLALLAETGVIRRLDVLPRPSLAWQETIAAGYASLPTVLEPASDAPVVAVIDSGVRSAHPLLAPAITGLSAVGVPDVHDANGHGTFVASLTLYGSLEPLLDDGAPVRAAGRLLSIRVLDDAAAFPDFILWEASLLAALEEAADAGARVVNLSIGDDRAPYASERPTPLGSAIDDFARRRNVVVVTSAGNYPLLAYAAAPDLASTYSTVILGDPGGGILDPATSALSLTVGALCADDQQGYRAPRDNVDRLPLGGQSFPSPVTRRGPGPRGMIKPELSAPGGGGDHDTATGRALPSPHRSVIGAAATPPERLLTTMSGTSVAAPLVTHVVLRALAANPTLSANGARALTLLSVTPHYGWFAGGLTEGAQRQMIQQLGGYGRPDGDRAAHSSDHRAVLLAEARIPVDGVHLYRVLLPPSFFDSGGHRRLSFALAFDPAVRATRLDHLSSRMHVNVYRGLTVDEVAEAYIRQASDEEQPSVDVADALAGRDHPDFSNYGDGEIDAGDESDDRVEGPTTIRKHLVKGLQPSEQRRSRGAHQYATRRFGQAFKPEDGLFVIFAVHNKDNNWSNEDAQSYALAVELERDDDRAALYADLRAFVEAEATATLEVQADVEVQLQQSAQAPTE